MATQAWKDKNAQRSREYRKRWYYKNHEREKAVARVRTETQRRPFYLKVRKYLDSKRCEICGAAGDHAGLTLHSTLKYVTKPIGLTCDRNWSKFLETASKGHWICESCNEDAVRVDLSKRLKLRVYWYRQDDKLKGLDTDIDVEFLMDILQSGCKYCGQKSDHLGLDRLDNTVGHVKSNVVACCSRCNLLKGNMPDAAWLCLVPAIRDATSRGLFGDWFPRKQSRKNGKTAVA